MPDLEDEAMGGLGRSARQGPIARAGALAARALEAETGRWVLWLPVLFAAGIVAYFSLTNEPSLRAAVSLLLAAIGLIAVLRNAPLGLAFGAACLAFALGFTTAKLRTEQVRAPVLAEELRHVDVSGFVERFEQRAGRRDRLTLRVIAIGDLPEAERPYRVRISTAAKTVSVATGEAVRLRATLRPPPEPVEPGGFDFARRAFFDRLGATGYATGRIEPLSIETMRDAPQPPLTLRAWSVIDALRVAVAEHVRAVLPGETGGVAVALLTGDRGGIPEAVTAAMRDASLAHVLAISGLHMVIMAGTVFWLARALLAAVPSLALRFPIKKWAACIAIAAATFYLLLSGASVPTLRAWIMMTIFLTAVLLDRPAISMRNVALAALAILIVMPESLFEPSFEMSFAAVIGLVAVYEWLSSRTRRPWRDVSPVWRGMRWVSAFVVGVAITTLVAGTAVAPFEAYHFHRMTHYGIIANLIAAPLVSILIMPMALLTLIAMPFGLEAGPLHVMGQGIGLMVAAAEEVASWPGAVSIVPDISGTALLLIVLGGLWLCLWQTRMRALGLVIIAAGLALAPAQQRPDVLIDREGAVAALRANSGNLVFPPATAATYSVENWLLADGDNRDPKSLRHAEPRPDDEPFRCDPLGCIGRVKGKVVALVRHPGALEEDCRVADIVIARFSVPKTCRAARVIVDRRALKDGGAHALYIEGLSIRTETVTHARGNRPWTRGQPSAQRATPTGSTE